MRLKQRPRTAKVTRTAKKQQICFDFSTFITTLSTNNSLPALYYQDHPRRPRGSQSSREKRRDESIFCAQSGAGIRLKFWKWCGESRYPGALPPLLENFRRAFSPEPTDCPWVSEDEARQAVIETIAVVYQLTKRTQEKLFFDWA